MSKKWTMESIPDQRGRVAVVTGANTGLGYETAKALAERGASVVLAVRNVEKGEQAAARMTGDVTVQALDLTSLDSVRTAAAALRSRLDRIDLLINNAGVMYTPKQTTRDGFEMQFGTNHLGHFALTGLLLDLMLPVPGSRVVTVSSVGHRIRAADAGRVARGDQREAEGADRRFLRVVRGDGDRHHAGLAVATAAEGVDHDQQGDQRDDRNRPCDGQRAGSEPRQQIEAQPVDPVLEAAGEAHGGESYRRPPRLPGAAVCGTSHFRVRYPG
jgi:NAD(P)-dependent dehydrogenase (short-subunit alcohol dehydrogenase family)